MKQIIRKGEAYPLEYLKKHCGIEVIAGPNRKLKLIILELSFFFLTSMENSEIGGTHATTVFCKICVRRLKKILPRIFYYLQLRMARNF